MENEPGRIQTLPIVDAHLESKPAVTAARLLEGALLFAFVAHGLGMLSMILFLLPGLPGGSSPDGAARIAYIAAHPGLWRLGWFPWQLSALSDIVLAVALLRTRWIPRLPAYLTLVFTLIALMPDQIGQAVWITKGVALATDAVRLHNPALYLPFEANINRIVSAWAAAFYTLGALSWTWCFVSAGTWNRRLTLLSIPTWSIFFFASIGPLLPGSLRPSAAIVGGANAAGFLLMQWWFLEVLEQVLRRSRRAEASRAFTEWKAPRGGPIGWITEQAANSETARTICEILPCLPFDSDITDVVYINYLADAGQLLPLVPAGMELQRLGPNGEYAIFTFLTYRHGRFGPRALRKSPVWLPSPIQSNWRVHVVDLKTGVRGVHFVTNAVGSATVALGARLMVQEMPAHALLEAELKQDPQGCFDLTLDPGKGSAPDVRAHLCPAAERALPSPWTLCFENYEALLAYIVPQNHVLGSQPWYGRITRQEIRLDIPLSDCRPMAGQVESRLAAQIAGASTPLCFHVPKVAFYFDRQQFDPIA